MGVQWKKVVLLGVLCGLLLLLFRGWIAARCGREPEASLPPVPEEPFSTLAISVFDHREEKLVSLDLETYILGVVAAEMPASFPEEALKAQAVAARTYAVYHMERGGCRANEGAAVCTSSACCQAYCSDERMAERWGGDYGANREKVRGAVLATAGEILLYQGETIDALYHSASGGRTENAEDVYGEALPYLRSVMSTAEAGTPRLTGQVRLTKKEFVNKVNGKWPKARLKTSTLENSVEILESTEAGRVRNIRLGGVTVTGKQLRGLLSLDSTLFTYSMEGKDILFSTRGYGHGVGMSQTGANAMAMGGRSYREILLYYYTDVTIGNLTDESGE